AHAAQSGSILKPISGIIDAPRATHQAGRARSGPRMDIVLTGIKPTGTLHIVNYVGAIKRAIAPSAARGVESYFFLADYHAIGGDADLVARATLEIAATWLTARRAPDKRLVS